MARNNYRPECPACGRTSIIQIQTYGVKGTYNGYCYDCRHTWTKPVLAPEPSDPIEQAIAKHADKLANIVRAEVTKFLTLWAGTDRDTKEKESTSCTGCTHAYIPEERLVNEKES